MGPALAAKEDCNSMDTMTSTSFDKVQIYITCSVLCQFTTSGACHTQKVKNRNDEEYLELSGCHA